KNDVEILDLLKRYHIDETIYGLGYTKLREIRKSLGLLGTRQQGHTIDTVAEDLKDLRELFPKAGFREMKSQIFDRKGGKKVSRAVVTKFFDEHEPISYKQARMGKNLKRKQFWAAGVNAIWCMDQHDKWKSKWGLCLHVAVDPFSGYLLWLRIWWNNSNPIVVGNYYLETVESLGCRYHVPLITQSDPGTENVRVANAHSFIRQYLDPALGEFIQHIYKRGHNNVKAEIEWSQLRRRWSPGFENILEYGLENGWFDPANPVQVLIFRFTFIPWLQLELDRYRNRVNNTSKRKMAHKLTPHGRPADIHFRPNDFDESRDFKVLVPPTILEETRATYIDENHRVLQLVPPSFYAVAQAAYTALGSPVVNEKNVWQVYTDLLGSVEQGILNDAIPVALVKEWSEAVLGGGEETADDRAAVEAQELQGGTQGPPSTPVGKELDMDGPTPYGFMKVGED
ncbi:hypothetical protein DFP72DRAFT_824746, partial [Ephemerocybe angulata]